MDGMEVGREDDGRISFQFQAIREIALNVSRLNILVLVWVGCGDKGGAYNCSSSALCSSQPIASSMAFFDLPIYQYHQGELTLSSQSSTSISMHWNRTW